jgi:flagellar basal-body rod protein FlgC
MSLSQVFEIASAGMDVQQLRLQVAASNVANAHTTAAPGTQPYRPLEVVVRPSMSQASGAVGGTFGVDGLPRPVAAAIIESDVPARRMYDPGHPDADKDGFVSLPGVDPVNSMMDLLEISRNYEANLRVFDMTRSLIQHTLEIGSKR